MTTIGSLDAPIEIFGGLVSDMAPADLPHGVSPDCQDVVFSSGGVGTRPGLQTLFGPLAANPAVNSVKSYITPSGTLRTIAQDANGNLYKEITPGTLTQIASGLTPNAYLNSTTLFGREYLATSDGTAGNDLPRQYDDTNLDRVSQGGPGAGPAVVDENSIVGIASSPSGATQPAAVGIVAGPNGAPHTFRLCAIRPWAWPLAAGFCDTNWMPRAEMRPKPCWPGMAAQMPIMRMRCWREWEDISRHSPHSMLYNAVIPNPRCLRVRDLLFVSCY
jgi:hypothetical protein